MIDVKTIVYFDLEATGLKSSGMPRICELSFVAVNIQDIPQLASTINDNKNFCEHSFVPRVINKLTLCIYPMYGYNCSSCLRLDWFGQLQAYIRYTTNPITWS